jgi:hypothetical protein
LHTAWELAIRLDGTRGRIADDTRSPDQVALGADASAFFARALAATERTPPRFAQLTSELKKVSFQLSGTPSIRQARLCWQWPKESTLSEQLRKGGRCALVASPFLKKKFLLELKERFQQVFVLGRQEDMDAFWDADIEELIPRKNVWVINDGEGSEPNAQGDTEPDDNDLTDMQTQAETATTQPFLDLHAKLLLCEYPKAAGGHLTEGWLGSANGTLQAWGISPNGTNVAANAEAMMHFSPAVGVQGFLREFIYRNEKDLILNGWIQQYVPGLPIETDDRAVAEKLQHIREGLAGLSLSARYRENSGGTAGELVLFTEEAEQWLNFLAKYSDHEFWVKPQAWEGPESAMTGLQESTGLAFAPIELHDVGELFHVRIRHMTTQKQTCFYLKVSLGQSNAFWESRRTAFLKQKLTAAQFRDLLRSILLEGAWRPTRPSKQEEGPEESGSESKRQPSVARGLLNDLSIEGILQSCTADPSRIDEIDRLVRIFKDSGHVDPEFLDFWTAFRKATEVAR